MSMELAIVAVAVATVMTIEVVMARAGLMMTVLIGPEGAAFFSARNLLFDSLVVIQTALLCRSIFRL
ncbi:MAG: hypothetical protein IJR22_09075, partial [Acidaminococcaceae bacterium]|nr:hypothetical protein [Acidaminococcaceae bacterium]